MSKRPRNDRRCGQGRSQDIECHTLGAHPSRLRLGCASALRSVRYVWGEATQRERQHEGCQPLRLVHQICRKNLLIWVPLERYVQRARESKQRAPWSARVYLGRACEARLLQNSSDPPREARESRLGEQVVQICVLSTAFAVVRHRMYVFRITMALGVADETVQNRAVTLRTRCV